MYNHLHCLLIVTILSIFNLSHADVKVGLDVLLDEHIELIQNKNVGIIANHTAMNHEGKSIVELIQKHANVVALFGPEHGFKGSHSAGEKVGDDSLSGIPIFSLYGNFRTPTPEMLNNVDVLIYDIQDVGVKFYTYISNLFLCMNAAKREGIPILVLDRPNPVDATRVEGAITNPAYTSFVGVIPLPARYGMTVGEIAMLMNGEKYAGYSLDTDLTVIPMKHYKRDMWYDETGLEWVAPSPNMPELDTAIAYPGLCLIEGTNLSEGRGTDAPFLTIGAPYIHAEKLLQAIPGEVKTGVNIKVVTFTPKEIPGVALNPKHEGKKCQGIQINITDRDKFMPIEFTVALLCIIKEMHPNEFTMRSFMDRLWGNEDLRGMIEAGNSYQEIMATVDDGLKQFNSVRKNYLLYD